MTKRVVLCLLALPLFVAVAGAPNQYFPPNSLGDTPYLDKITRDWYSKNLIALQEPSLWSLSKTQKYQSFRFLYLPAFTHPMAIRMDVDSEGSSSLTIKVTSYDASADKQAHLIENRTLPLTKERTQRFISAVEANQFGSIPSREHSSGKDGARWIFEGIGDGNYHFIDRWSPKNGPARELGVIMACDLAYVSTFDCKPTEPLFVGVPAIGSRILCAALIGRFI